MNDPTLRQLHIFCAVARLGSFTQAAEELELGQPAASQHVAALERALGVPLVLRAGRGTRLTEAGRLVAEYGERVLRLIEQLHAGLDGLAGLTTGRLVVGAGQTPGDYILPIVLGEFQRLYPGVSVELEIAHTRQVVEWLLRHRYDLGFIGAQVDQPNLVIEPFVEDRVVLFAASGHPLSKRAELRPVEVMETGLIAREPGSATRATGEQAFRAAGVEPRYLMELGSNEAVKRAVLAGFGIGMLSIYALEVERQAARLQVLRVMGFGGRRMLYIARHRDTPLTAAQSAFLTLARQVAASPLLR